MMVVINQICFFCEVRIFCWLEIMEGLLLLHSGLQDGLHGDVVTLDMHNCLYILENPSTLR